MRSYVLKTIEDRFATLHQIRIVLQSLPPSVKQILVVKLVLLRLDYGNAMVAGIPAYLLCCLKSMPNAVAGLQCSMHISTMLANLHRLRAAQRIKCSN